MSDTLRARSEVLEKERVEIMDALDISADGEGSGYWVRGKLSAICEPTLADAAKEARCAPEHRWWKVVKGLPETG